MHTLCASRENTFPFREMLSRSVITASARAFRAARSSCSRSSFARRTFSREGVGVDVGVVVVGRRRRRRLGFEALFGTGRYDGGGRTTTTTRATSEGGEEPPPGGAKKSRFTRRAEGSKPPPAPLGSGPPSLSSSEADPSFDDVNSRIKVIPLEQTRFQGVANIDRENGKTVGKDGGIELSTTATAKNRSILFGGDVAAFSIFSAIGRMNHGERMNPLDVAATASPFVLGWVTASYLLGTTGAFGDYTRKSDANVFKEIVPAAVKTVLLGVPLGIAFRSVASFHVPDFSFLFVSLGVNSAFLLLWRAILAPKVPPNATKNAASSKTGSKRGNPLEFLSLLSGLVKRW